MQVFCGIRNVNNSDLKKKHLEPCSQPMGSASGNLRIISCGFRLFSANGCYATAPVKFHSCPSRQIHR